MATEGIDIDTDTGGAEAGMQVDRPTAAIAATQQFEDWQPPEKGGRKSYFKTHAPLALTSHIEKPPRGLMYVRGRRLLVKSISEGLFKELKPRDPENPRLLLSYIVVYEDTDADPEKYPGEQKYFSLFHGQAFVKMRYQCILDGIKAHEIPVMNHPRDFLKDSVKDRVVWRPVHDQDVVLWKPGMESFGPDLIDSPQKLGLAPVEIYDWEEWENEWAKHRANKRKLPLITLDESRVSWAKPEGR